MKWIYTRLESSEIQENLLQKMTFLNRGFFFTIYGEGNEMVKEELKKTYHQNPGLIIVDEGHEVFHNYKIEPMKETVYETIESNRECRILILSDPFQASSSTMIYPEGLSTFTLNEVSRSSQHLVTGSMSFGLRDISNICYSHESKGVPLQESIFNQPNADNNIHEMYATKVSDAIEGVLNHFPGIVIHGRLVIIVPDEDFCNNLCRHLKIENYGMRHVCAEDTSRSLCSMSDDDGSMCTVDTVSKY